MERAHDGCGAEGQFRDRATDLEETQTAAASRGVVQVSNDPHFAPKVRDIVGLYMNSPDKAIVLTVDEKSQIQALDRTQPILPLVPACPSGKRTITNVTGRRHCSLR